MADNVENLIIEQLRPIRASIDNLAGRISTLTAGRAAPRPR
jgi:hypothetical protein